MTLPVVTETSQPPEPVDRDTFLDPADRVCPPLAEPARRRPADA